MRADQNGPAAVARTAHVLPPVCDFWRVIGLVAEAVPLPVGDLCRHGQLSGGTKDVASSKRNRQSRPRPESADRPQHMISLYHIKSALGCSTSRRLCSPITHRQRQLSTSLSDHPVAPAPQSDKSLSVRSACWPRHPLRPPKCIVALVRDHPPHPRSTSAAINEAKIVGLFRLIIDQSRRDLRTFFCFLEQANGTIPGQSSAKMPIGLGFDSWRL